MPVAVTRWPTRIRTAGARLLSQRRGGAQPRTRGRAIMASQDSAPQFVPVSTRDDGFRVVSERVLHSRYVTLYDRTVEFPSSGKGQDEAAPTLRFDYDVLGHPRAGFHFVSIFPFHSGVGGEPSCTAVREYGQVSSGGSLSLSRRPALLLTPPVRPVGPQPPGLVPACWRGGRQEARQPPGRRPG